MKEAISVILLDEQQNILLYQRPERSKFAPLRWALIGGKIDPGEDRTVAAAREVYEELGIQIEPEFFIEFLNDLTDPMQPWLVYVFIATVKEEICANPEEVAQHKFVDPAEAKEMELAFHHGYILSKYLAQKKEEK